MGKRSDFEKIPHDLYRSWDKRIVPPLLKHVSKRARYCEPCAGANDLVDQLAEHGIIAASRFDLIPLKRGIKRKDALKLTKADLNGARTIITNPPWTRALLHAMIDHFLSLNVTVWLLFDADWMHTAQSARFMPYCDKIVSIGRLRWIPDTTMDAVDSAAWYCFSNKHIGQPTLFYGRE